MIRPTYSALEKELKIDILKEIGIYRPFVDIAEQNDWEGKKSDDHFRAFIKDVGITPIKTFDLNDAYGGIHLNMSGYLDIPTLIASSRAFLSAIGAYQEKQFDESKLVISPKHISYEGSEFKKIIFCNGLGAAKSSYFSWLPFSPVKGEVLIGTTEKSIDKIYNRGIFILPAGNKKIKVGATYKNNFEHDQPTEEGRNVLLDKMVLLTKEKFSITEAKAGLRPATKDRRPFIGKHPEYEHIYIFNGFGSKGVSLIPYFSKNFVDYLEGNNSLNDDVNIQRFVSLYNNAS